jgi:hypothetical protein
MTEAHCCDEMRQHLGVGEVALRYSPKLREYGLRVLDGGSSRQEIRFCPWCGSRLPESLRDEWFKKLDELRLEPDSPAIPTRLRSDEWWTGKACPKFSCRCCGFLTLFEPSPGSFKQCPVCGWIDDDLQASNPLQASGQNSVTLRRARQNFAEIGAISRRLVSKVRGPRPEEVGVTATSPPSPAD